MDHRSLFFIFFFLKLKKITVLFSFQNKTKIIFLN